MPLVNNREINSEVLNGEALSDGTESLLNIEKEIVLRISSSAGESLLSIEKKVITTASGSLLPIEKRIVGVIANTFYTRNGWEPIITLGGMTVDAEILHGLVKVIKIEDDNATAQFTIILRPGVYDLTTFMGKPVTISVRKDGVVYRRFTGIVDIPAINVLEEKLTLNCIADRRNLLSTLGTLEPFLGIYSDVVLGASDDTYERITARLETTSASLDFDSYNQPTLTSWTPNPSPNFSYGSSEVYRKRPQMFFESAKQIINTVNLKLEYGYQRCHHRQIAYVWNHTYAPTDPINGLGGICPFLIDRPTMPTKELIRSTIAGINWPVRGDIFFGKQFKTGSYQCSGQWVMWSTIETGGFQAGIVDSNGNPVLDGNGNQLQRSVTTILADNTDLYTMNAAWNATTRFNQNIKESYEVTVRAPLSVATYGALQTTESYATSTNNPFDEWESQYVAYTNPPGGVTLHPSNPTSSYFFNGDLDRSRFSTAFVCALQKAKATILRSHRDTRIIYQRELTPDIELKHTVSLTGKWMRGTGKVRRIEDIMCVSDCEEGTAGEAFSEIELATYKNIGAISETALNVTSPPVDEPNVQQPARALQTHLGIDPSSSGSENWTGYVGNIAIAQQIQTQTGTITNHTRTNFQEAFIVTAPAIQPDFRDDRTITKAATYNINIPTDDVEYEAHG